ncbi:MAG: DMT family transporter [Bacteroidales bacterium]|nr:DMT family transporter [Bacteroidales bacterium]
MTNQNKSYIYALSAILFWSTIGSAFKITLRYISFAELLFYAVLVSFLFLLLSIKAGKKGNQFFSLSLPEIFSSALLGFINPFLYYLVLLKAYDILPAQEAGTLNYIWPVVLVLLSIPLLKQKIGFWSLIAILVSFTGTLVIATRGDLTGLNFGNPLGVALALCSAIFWSVFWIYNVKDKRDEVVKLFLNFGFGLIYIFIYLLITKGFHPVNTFGILGSVYIGIFEMGLTFILWLKAMKFSSTTAKISNLVFLSPFLSLIIIHFAVGETILPSTIVGLVIIVGGILMQRSIGFKKAK